MEFTISALAEKSLVCNFGKRKWRKIEMVYAELEDAMAMCGAHSLNEITRDMVR